MNQCKPGNLDPQREIELANLGKAAKALYNKHRGGSMPTWTQLVSDAKQGIELLAKSKTTQTGGSPTNNQTRRYITSAAFLLALMLTVMMGYLVYQGVYSGVPEYRRMLGEGCNDLAYDAVLRLTGIPLYPGCQAYHTARENLLAFMTNQRAVLVHDEGMNMQRLVNWLQWAAGGGGLIALWRQLMQNDGEQDYSNPPPSPPPPPPYTGRKGPGPGPGSGDGSDEGGPGGIATGGKRRRNTRRAHKKVNKTRRRKALSRRK